MFEDEDSIRYYGSNPRLVEQRIIESIPEGVTIQIQESMDKYLRCKLTPVPSEEFFKELKQQYRMETKVYTSDDSCILELTVPQFDIIIIRDTSKFPKYNGWILQVMKYNSLADNWEVIATLQYNEDHPYNLKVAQHLLDYLNKYYDTLPTDYKEIYTIY